MKMKNVISTIDIKKKIIGETIEGEYKSSYLPAIPLLLLR